jgi:GNAT superfamily N-acetyltransferase
VRVTPENFREHPQAICFINPKHEYYNRKVEWFIEQYAKGLRIIILYIEGEKRSVGFIEYVPGEYCWRAVDAKNYMFIHCLWIYGKKYQHQGLGSLLIREAEKEAKDMNGVAVVTSNGSFIANKTIFLKNGYDVVADYGNDQLLVKHFKDSALPSFNVNTEMLKKHTGLTIIYSRQCPWVARSVEEIKPIIEREKLNPEIIEIRSSNEAQHAPSVYSVFNLIYNGKVLADRYISTKRFYNIIHKEIKPLLKDGKINNKRINSV